MTAEEIDKLTIGEVRAISERASDALAKFAEARALLGGATPAPPAGSPQALRLARPSTKGVQLTEEEIAEREALVAMNRGSASDGPEFPPSIAAALGGT